jgi:hypothetical protein
VSGGAIVGTVGAAGWPAEEEGGGKDQGGRGAPMLFPPSILAWGCGVDDLLAPDTFIPNTSALDRGSPGGISAAESPKSAWRRAPSSPSKQEGRSPAAPLFMHDMFTNRSLFTISTN